MELPLSSHIYSTEKQKDRKDTITKDEIEELCEYIITLSRKTKT